MAAGAGACGSELLARIEVDAIVVAVGGGGLMAGIAADSLGARRIGAVAYAVATRTGVRSALVREQDLVDARRRLWSEYRIAVEYGAAAAFAALASGAYAPEPGARVAILLCGANTDPSDL